jgi:hypothetical protein
MGTETLTEKRSGCGPAGGSKMRKLDVLSSALLTVLALSSQAMANTAHDPMRMDLPITGGTGCPAGTVSATLTSDQTQLSILFDQFVAEAGGNSGKSLDRKACDVSIPIKMPHGYSISILQVDYRGFNSVPRGGMTEMSAEYFFTNQRGIRSVKRFTTAQDDDYMITNRLGVESLIWTPCGKDVILRTKLGLVAKSNYYGESVMATLDSADISSGVVYQVQWRRCDGSAGDLGGVRY